METSWPFVGNRVYTCEANVTAFAGHNSIDAVGGGHLSGRTDHNVQGLSVSDQEIKKIPKNIAKFFPNIKGIQLSNTNLTSISANDLKPFQHLIIISMTQNMLKTLDADLFQFTPHLQWIDFSENVIESVGFNLMINLTDLRYADFSGNRCINLIAYTYKELRNLKILVNELCVKEKEINEDE